MLNALAKRIYDFNVTMGWHNGPPDLADYLMNLHSEVSELWEAWRRGEMEKPCDKNEKMAALGIGSLSCIEEELADILIRTLDTAKAFGVDIDRAVEIKMAYNATREPSRRSQVSSFNGDGASAACTAGGEREQHEPRQRPQQR